MHEAVHQYFDPELPADSVMGDGPLVYFQRPLDKSIEVDLDATVSFLKSQNVAKTTLDHLMICIEKPVVNNAMGDVSEVVGSTIQSCQLDNGETYSPIVAIFTRPESIQERTLNSVFRHELAHIINHDNGRPPYRDKNILSSVKTLGLCALTYNILLAGDYTESLTSCAAGLGSTVLGMFVASSPSYAVHRLTPREIKADYFAWRHRDFNPIHVKQ